MASSKSETFTVSSLLNTLTKLVVVNAEVDEQNFRVKKTKSVVVVAQLVKQLFLTQ